MAKAKKNSRLNTILIIIAVIFVYNWVFDDEPAQNSNQTLSESSSPLAPGGPMRAILLAPGRHWSPTLKQPSPSNW